ncbi:MAG: pyridoxal-phosphate dependent enzyme [Dehalococcoidia bacterium]
MSWRCAARGLRIPVGNAGNISAYWRGFTEYAELGRASATPRMMGFQAAGAAPSCSAIRSRRRERWRAPSASATPPPGNWRWRRQDESGGDIQAITDDEILEAYRLMATEDGIFCGPASAASVAGAAQAGAGRRGPARRHGGVHHHRRRAERPEIPP